jgi:hypothetical protein
MLVRIEIKSRPGTFIILDDDVADKIGQWGWWLLPNGYVEAYLPGSGRKNQKKAYLSRAVVWATTGEWPPTGMEVDHINHDKLDNRMENLRVVIKSVNQRNMNKREGGASQFQGVFWDKRRQKWYAMAGVTIDGKLSRICSSLTPDEVIAAKCADVMRQLIGGWLESKLNYQELTFFDKWYQIGEKQQKQILHSMNRNNVPIDPLSPYRSWYRAA